MLATVVDTSRGEFVCLYDRAIELQTKFYRRLFRNNVQLVDYDYTKGYYQSSSTIFKNGQLVSVGWQLLFIYPI